MTRAKKRAPRALHQVSVSGATFAKLRANADARGVLLIDANDALVSAALDAAIVEGWKPAPSRKRPYRTHEPERDYAKNRRDGLRAQRLCLNGKSHGKATHGCRCATCHETHRRSR